MGILAFGFSYQPPGWTIQPPRLAGVIAPTALAVLPCPGAPVWKAATPNHAPAKNHHHMVDIGHLRLPRCPDVSITYVRLELVHQLHLGGLVVPPKKGSTSLWGAGG